MNWMERAKKLLDIRFVKKTIRWSRSISIPGFEGLPLFDVFTFFIQRLHEGELQTRARSMAFSLLLALFPAVIFIFTLIPYIPLESFQDRLLFLIRDLLPSSTFDAASETIEDIIHRQHGGLLSFGFLFALFVTTDGIIALMNWFNKSYHGHRQRPGWKQRLIATGITFAISFLVILSIGLIVVSEIAYSYIEEKGILVNLMQMILITIGKWIILILLCFSAISLLYYLGPSNKDRMRFISAGSSLATLLLIITSLGFNFFITHFAQYNKVYGSIGTLIIILLWLYINSLVLLVGYELNVSIKKARRITPLPNP